MVGNFITAVVACFSTVALASEAFSFTIEKSIHPEGMMFGWMLLKSLSPLTTLRSLPPSVPCTPISALSFTPCSPMTRILLCVMTCITSSTGGFK
uniref:NEK5 n=1 Tax=Arundo donax TaxID=35708 RepID=A0A0A9DCH0_ARUDO